MKNIFHIIRSSFLLIMLLASGYAHAQTSITVKGMVKDTSGSPMVGAVVVADGTSVGTITDFEGRYTMTIPLKEGKVPTLTFSSISYVSQTVKISGRRVIDVILEEDSELLEEVVVVGYGAMRKSDLTGSVTSVKIDETQASQSGSIDQLLQGQAAGVQVVSNSAAPDGGVSVLVRGASSFNSSSQPLYVVDGVIINASGSISMGTHGGNESGIVEDNNGLIGINPQDIASMEILKDASATAIYGSQGANGVVLITTKQASQSKPSVVFSSGVSICHVYKKYDLMDADDYVKYLDMKGVNPTSGEYTIYTKSVENGTYAPVDWQDYTMQTGVSQRYYLTVEGRPKNTNYRLSVGYSDNEGVIRNTGYKNLFTRINFDRTIGKFKIGTNTSFSWLNSRLTQGSGGTIQQTPATSLIMSMLMTRPLRRVVEYDDEGTEVDNDESNLSGPDRWLNDYDSRRVEYRVISSMKAEYKIMDYLTFQSKFGFDYRSNERSMFKSMRINTQGTGSNGSVSHVDRLGWNWDNLLIYNQKINKHRLSATLGQTANQSITRTMMVEGTNVVQWKAMSASLNSAPYTWLTYSEGQSQLLSFFTRATYNFDERYVITGTYRFDGSSKFAGKNKWAQFPSFAAAWRISNEPWFKRFRFTCPNFTSAKLRLGWGRVGNQAIPGYQTSYSYSSSNTATHDNESQKLTSLSSNKIPTADLKWETTSQYNAGLDLDFFKGRLVITADGYYKLTEDLLQTMILAGSAGVNNPYVNMGAISNTGLELTINAVPVSRSGIEWTIGGNITVNRNKVVSINPSGSGKAWKNVYYGEPMRRVEYFTGSKLSSSSVNADYLNIFIAGEPMSLFYGLPTNGIVPEGETGTPLSDGAERGPGSINFLDTNGDLVIDERDKVVIGNPNPDFTYGFNTSFRYKRLRISASFVGSYGNDIYNQQLANLSDLSTNSSNRLRAPVFDCWSSENKDSMWPAVSAYNSNDLNLCSDRYVEDGSYLRLANASISYSFPINSKRQIIRNIAFSISGKNLYCWTKYSGYDPDVNVYGSVLKYGIDMGAYPSGRTYMFDVKFYF